MSYLLVPNEVESASARLWIAVLDEPAFNPSRLSLQCDRLGALLLNEHWDSWRTQDGRGIGYQRVSIQGMQPRLKYIFRLQADHQDVAVADLTTLPDKLPVAPDKPFTILLGSCFFSERDKGSLNGTIRRLMSSGLFPELKILCGDQVYLDAPWYSYWSTSHTIPELQKVFFEKYFNSWGGNPSSPGLRDLLCHGGNYFSSDDHEYWNNAPGFCATVPELWGDSAKQGTWLTLAKNLNKIFQTDRLTNQFSVPPASFLVVDTRYERDADGKEFVSPAHLDRLKQWISNLNGPGFLVLGQPVFAKKANFFGKRIDTGLPDFNQYADLVQALQGSSHSIVVLTGDVHFGRVAQCKHKSGARMVEVISSPLCLVWGNKGTWSKPPALFPDRPDNNIITQDVVTWEDYKMEENNFVTLELLQSGAKVRMVVKYWRIGDDKPDKIISDLPELE
jgi:hypothetical protein